MSFKMPNVVNQINKTAKTTKITTLDKAVALTLKRFFSGSFLIDDLVGGGYAYRRIQMLYGAKSSGKNAQLNQMIAYNQRICKNCGGVRPDFAHLYSSDRWVFVLKYYMRLHDCECDNFIPRKSLMLDYEKALAIEASKFIEVKTIKYKDKNGEVEVDELDYNDKVMALETLKLKDKQSEEDLVNIKSIEEWINSLTITTKTQEQINTKDYLIQCGVLINELLVADPEDTEEGIEICRDVVHSKEVDSIIWDSLQAAVPKYVKERDADQATMGAEAKQNGLLMRLVSSAYASADLTDPTESYKPALFVTSQVRADLGSFVAKQPTYSGGMAVQHHISLALEVKRQLYIGRTGLEAKFKEDFYGQRIRIRPEKNKLGVPGGMYEYDYYFKEAESYRVGEINHLSEIVTLATKYGVIQQAGAYYRFLDKNVQGKQKVMEILKDDPNLVGNMYAKIKEVS